MSTGTGTRKIIQNLKENAGNHSDEEIYAMLKECAMDPNETAQKLLVRATEADAIAVASPSPALSPEIVIPLDWEAAAESVALDSSAPVVLVCGPKNSGKSTFSRYLLNTLLRSYKKVGYMDTDVGQPEFVPPGCLSLNIVDQIITDIRNPCLKVPERLIFFGDISSKRDPNAFLTYSFHLYDYFVKEYCQSNELGNRGHLSMPLIINTPGWVKGTGYDVLVEILRHTSPTKVVQICSLVEARNLPPGAFWLSGQEKEPSDLISIFTPRLASSSKSAMNKNANSMRDRRLFDYFRQCFPDKLNITTNKELAYFLASLPPYEVQLSRIRVMHLHCQVPSTEIFHSLNATIVGLASSTHVNADSRSFTPWCLGLGIVRGIDVSKGVIYVITPVPLCRLQMVDLLLQGFIDIPTGLLQVRKCLSPYMSTNVLHKM